jgi:tRNA (guanine-N7-)-methyltransferase
MRRNNTATPAAALVQYMPEPDEQPLDLRLLFPNAAPLVVDLGCGDGSFIAALAAEHPEWNFLGVEKLLGRVRSACRKIAARPLPNARILRVDIESAVTSLLPAGSVEVCHIMFPDPWPKRRHHRRRTVTADLLRAITRVLVPDGVLRLTTDDLPYFEQMQQAAAAVPELAPLAEEVPAELPRSTFERRFVESGLPIYRLSLRNVSADR